MGMMGFTLAGSSSIRVSGGSSAARCCQASSDIEWLGVLAVAQGVEVFNIAKSTESLRDGFGCLDERATCQSVVCRAQKPALSATVVDLDAAYENILGSLIHRAWVWACSDFVKKTGASGVHVKKGRRCEARDVESGYNSQWFSVSVETMTKCLLGFTAIAPVLVCGEVFLMQGLPIGGLLSSIALSLVLNYLESYENPIMCEWWSKIRSRVSESEGWLPDGFGSVVMVRRIVDDLFSCSPVLCSECLQNMVKDVYGMLVSVCSVDGASHVWCEVEIHMSPQGKTLLAPKSANREWLLSNLGAFHKTKATFVLAPGVSPYSPKTLGRRFWTKLKRLKAYQFSRGLIVHRLLEDVLELCRLGYSFKFVRSLLHCIPFCEESVQVREFWKTFSRTCCVTPTAAMSKSDKSFKGAGCGGGAGGHAGGPWEPLHALSDCSARCLGARGPRAVAAAACGVSFLWVPSSAWFSFSFS